MLWSLLKILFFVAMVAALTLGAGYLMESGPGVRLAVGTIEFNLGPLQAVLAALAGLAVIWLAFRLAGLLVALLRFINGDETALSRYFDRNRERKGFRAIADALIALASGDARLAITRARAAERLLRQPELTNLIIAQAAQAMGDTRKATETYKALLTSERTRFIGIQGLLQQKMAEGETETARALAEKAFALKPGNAEVQDILLRLQAERHDWSGARKTLGAKLKTGQLPRDLHRRRDAVLALSEAADVLAEGQSIAAREQAIAANKLSPDLVPAAAMAARSYIEQGKTRNALRVLRKAWEAQPHPDLAAAFAEIVPNEAPAARIARFDTLTRIQPDHPETRMLKTELLIAAEDFPGARRALGDLPETQPTTRSLSLMAAIERGLGADDAVVRGWLARAVTASRGPQWVCDKCQTVAAKWAPVCECCGGFDTLAWKVPPRDEVAMPGGAEMLPLIVGKPAARPQEDQDEAVEAVAEKVAP